MSTATTNLSDLLAALEDQLEAERAQLGRIQLDGGGDVYATRERIEALNLEIEQTRAALEEQKRRDAQPGRSHAEILKTRIRAYRWIAERTRILEDIEAARRAQNDAVIHLRECIQPPGLDVLRLNGVGLLAAPDDEWGFEHDMRYLSTIGPDFTPGLNSISVERERAEALAEADEAELASVTKQASKR